MAIVDLVTISFDEESGIYRVHMPQGSTINETLFSVSVLIKCLVKDNFYKSYKEALDVIERYCTDPQFEEIKEEDPFEEEEKEDGKRQTKEK